jgi:hypothetical protein
MQPEKPSAACARCNDTGYHGPWGDSSSDDDSPRRCNHCDFHRGPERAREIERARRLLEENGFKIIAPSAKPKPVRVLGVEAVHRADTRWSGFGRRFVHVSPGEHESTITADCDEATANALLALAREKVSG